MLSLESISGVLVLGDACTSDSTACEQAESICVHYASKGRGKNRVPVQKEQRWGSSTSIAPHQELLMLPRGSGKALGFRATVRGCHIACRDAGGNLSY